jgi:hypothetical protein
MPQPNTRGAYFESFASKWLKLLRKASRLQVIQNSAPSIVRWRQCDIRIALLTKRSEVSALLFSLGIQNVKGKPMLKFL